MEYTVLRVKDRKELPVHPRDYRFEIGEQIALRILPKDDVYLYVFAQGPTGDKECLWPLTDDVQKPAQRDQVFEIPPFFIHPPPGDEKLILVATIEPSKDLAGLTDRVFKKLDKELSAAERARKKALLEETDHRLQGIQRQNQRSAPQSAIPSPAVITQFNATVKATKHANILELPAGQETSTFAMTVADKSLGKPALFEVISLKTVDGESAPK